MVNLTLMHCETVKDLISKMTVEILNLRPNMLVNVTPVTDH